MYPTIYYFGKTTNTIIAYSHNHVFKNTILNLAFYYANAIILKITKIIHFELHSKFCGQCSIKLHSVTNDLYPRTVNCWQTIYNKDCDPLNQVLNMTAPKVPDVIHLATPLRFTVTSVPLYFV